MAFAQQIFVSAGGRSDCLETLTHVCKRTSLRLCFSLPNRFFPLRTLKIDSLAGRIAEASHVQMVCTSAFFTALV